MADLSPELARVARVVGDLPGEPDRAHLSSGYRISDRLILTTAHELAHTTALAADLGGEGTYRPVTCVWRGGTMDLALLRFDTAPATRVPPVRLGSVPRDREAEVAARAVGHPRWAQVDRRTAGEPDAVWRGRTGVRCAIRTADAEAPGLLRVGVKDAAPAPAPAGESPWQGMSGAAVRTEESGLLVGVVTDHVPAAGVGMLQVTALDSVDDDEWRALLGDEDVDPRPLPVLPDGWRRTRAVQQHHVRMDRIRRTPQPLVPEKLPYVDPGGAAAPAAVLDRLAGMAASPGLPAGVLVVGEPGAGKTRLCLETAALAEDSREWLVVHVTAAAPLTDVWDSVDGQADRVLVVADDVDRIASPGEKYTEVFREAAGAGVRLAVLTTVRRARLDALKDDPLTPYQTFETLDIRWDPSYHRAISREMVRSSLASEAGRQLDEDRLVGLCAGPPAVSQLCAVYYDSLARAGSDLTGVPPRPDREFSIWLRDILHGMKLPAVPADGDPDPATTAVAQLVVHAPRPFKEALDIFAPGRDDPRRTAGAETIGSLVTGGLLYAQDDALRPAHDVYADGLLGHAVLTAGQRTVHPRGLRLVLETGLADGRALVRVATAVDRLRDTLDVAAGDKLAGVVGEWGDDRRTALRELVLADPKGRELRALLALPTWRPVAVRRLAEPWLEEHHTEIRARDTVLTAARYLPAALANRYLFDWIYDHAHRPQAALAFQQALENDDLDPAVLEWTTDQVYEWLTQNAPRLSACRPLQRILDTSRNGLPPEDPRVGQVLTWALRWLRRYGTRREAGFVARPLVLHPELKGADLTRTARLLLDSVAPDDPPSATFALEAVLARHRLHRDLDRGVYEQAVADSFAWLADDAGYGLRRTAAYLLKELVVPGLPGRDGLARAVQAAWIWLEPNAGHHVEMGKVLPGLLKNAAKSRPGQHAAFVREEREELGRLAMDWLEAHEDSGRNSGSEVLGALLGTPLPDGDPERLRWLVDEALVMLGDRPAPSVARSVLAPLLYKRYADKDLRDRVVAATYAQLPPAAPPSRHMAFPLTKLVERTDLGEAEHERAMTGTLEWLNRYPRASGAPALLAEALRSRRTTPGDRVRLAARAVGMLTPRTLLPERKGKEPRLPRALLTYRADTPTEWNRFVARACDLLTDEKQPREAVRVLRVLLAGADRLDGPVLTRLHRTCLDWCEVHDHTDRAFSLLIPALDNRALPPDVRRRASRLAVRRLRPGGERNSAHGNLLESLLRSGELPDADEVDRVLEAALDWLEAHRSDHAAVDPLLVQVARWLERPAGTHRTEARLRRAMVRIGTWLDDRQDGAPERREALDNHRQRLAALLDRGGEAT
ncbi:trypsin-like peptidase domain-containing protein [Streptomyces sp. CNQ-509]|uniref:trypsin-like peptidase domain-containing protein n=1 Tax=Streptomyces sp. CNQ-509 TaxID=444103 RepID=UPI00099B8182|nr:trypsin-like peptidase domain-containing protein [Streptomyces sp. CNQ-509]